MLKMKVLGGGREVGRSSFLLDSGEKILLEHGIKLNPDRIQYPLKLKSHLDAAIISHAHLDHSGNLPALYTDSCMMSFMTLPTLELSKLLWADSLKIAKAEGTEATYTKAEVQKTEKFTFPLGYRKKVDVTENVFMEFFDAGHILGGAMVKLDYPQHRLLYTGDFKINETRLHYGADTKFGDIDTLVMESTYGDREHGKRKEIEKEFVESVQDTIDRGGWALVPAFAVGRSQEMIDILHEYNLDTEVFLDGMAKKAARIILDFPEFLKDPKFLGKALHSTTWVERHNKGAIFREPGVIVSTAGMLEGGPALNYLKRIYSDKNSSVFLTGYQVEGTKGRQLAEKGTIVIDGEELKVDAEVKKFDFSAHASHSELMKMAEKAAPERIVLIHGDDKIIEGLQKELKGKGFSVEAPANGETVGLA